MKEIYERPKMMIELFTIQQAIATCSEADVVFDCMLGNQTDTTNVIISDLSCSNPAKYAAVKVASHPNGSSNHSTHTTDATWNSTNNGLTYTASSSAVGLLAICAHGNGQNATYSTNYWNVNGTVLEHTANVHQSQNNYHCQIATVYDYDTMNTGS